MKKLDKEQVKETLENMLYGCGKFCTDQAGKFTKEFMIEIGLIEEEFEVKKWYKSKFGVIVFFERTRTGVFYGYGFNANGHWMDDDGCNFTNKKNYWTLATGKEVGEALIKEAKKRGFGNNVDFISLETGGTVDCKNIRGIFDYSKRSNALLLNGHYVFQNGKWAEIVEEKKETPIEVVINGATYIKKLYY